MALKAGTITDLSNSMAQAIEQAFIREWPKIMGDDEPAPVMQDQMRLLFIAVAQGIVRHLVDHPEAFVVDVKNAESHDHDADVTITSTGTLYG